MDVITEWIKATIDQNANPCEDFYRHVCPLNTSVELQSNSIIEQIYKLMGFNTLPKIEENIVEKLEKFLEDSETFKKRMGLEYEQKCLEDHKSVGNLLKLIEEKLSPGGCKGHYCFTTIADDQNCTRAADKLVTVFDHIMEDRSVLDTLETWHNKALDFYKTSYVANTDIHKNGIRKIIDVVEDIKTLTLKRVKKTPWIINFQSLEAYKNMIRLLKFDDNLDESYRDLKNVVEKMDGMYENCTSSYSDSKFTGEFVCFIEIAQLSSQPTRLKTQFNAGNKNPIIEGSVPMFIFAYLLEDYTTFLGMVGTTLAHEIGHSVFERPGIDNLMPYFPKDLVDCVQGQFNKTCQYFKEESCAVADNQIDENGADIFGMRIAYDLLADHYGDSLFDRIPELNITRQQLFFYAYTFFYCHGTPSKTKPNDVHSVPKIRINVLANLPEFHEAFQCDCQSKMFKSATEECIVVGKNSKATRKIR